MSQLKPTAITTFFLTLTILCSVGCKPSNDPATRHAEAVMITKRLVARDAEHPMHADLKLSNDKEADTKSRTDASARTKLNCEDFVELRKLIDIGLPLADYTPIEKLGRFIGGKPHRFFLCGLGGFVNDQGPEPYTIMIEVDSSNVIIKIGPIVSAR